VAIRRTWGEKWFDGVNIVVLFLLMAATLYPLIYVAFASISNPTLFVRHSGLLLFPQGFTVEAYKLVMNNPMIYISYLNTLLYVVAGTALNLVMTILGAYALSRKDLYWKNAVTLVIVFTMFFSGGLIPLYLTVMDLGLLNNRLALILPVAINTMNLIIMRTSFLSIPVDLEESATIDGANDFTILLRVILPLSGPIIAVMILYYGVAHWNSWFNAMIFLRDRELYPLQLILREILLTNSTDTMMTGVSSVDKTPVGETIKYATIIVATIPILFVYPFLQRYFVKGVMIGALKG
jgi:putative aldouronate transport system permease protein